MGDATLPSVAGLRTLVIGALEESGGVAPVAGITATIPSAAPAIATIAARQTRFRLVPPPERERQPRAPTE